MNCAKGCGKKEGLVIGTSIYQYESSICKSAVHYGAIKDNFGGTV